MDVAAIEALLADQFPQAVASGAVIEAAGGGRARVRQPVGDAHLRPGGTVSGPTLMALADLATYVAILAVAGPVALAVTTSLHIDFLRRPEPRDVVADCELLKVGRRLAVGRVVLASDGRAEPIAHASVTYSLPPRA